MTLAEVTLAALLSLPTYVEDRAPELADQKRGQLEAVASAIANASADQTIVASRHWAALLVAIGYAETGFSLRIHRGECKPHECDRGKARGPWQVHRYGAATTTWDQMTGLANVKVQALVASSRLTSGYYTCRGRADWLQAAINGYAGRRCDIVWPGLNSRVATWRKAVRAMERAGQT